MVVPRFFPEKKGYTLEELYNGLKRSSDVDS